VSYPQVWSETVTLDIAHEGKSLARFGDGELKLALGASAKSQAWHRELGPALKAVLIETRGPCLPCIPNIDTFRGPKEPFWQAYRSPRYTQLYDKAATYGSAFVTRPDSAPHIDQPAYWERVIDLWRGKDVVLVRGSEKSLTAERLVGAHEVREIVGPRQHAWAEHREIFERLKRETRPVLMCLGATATVLAHRLAHEGVHALDLGHIGMFLKRRGADGRTGLDYVKGDAA
jgi:hypothetical protein